MGLMLRGCKNMKIVIWSYMQSVISWSNGCVYMYTYDDDESVLMSMIMSKCGLCVIEILLNMTNIMINVLFVKIWIYDDDNISVGGWWFCEEMGY